MNNLIFVDHTELMFTDRKILASSEYKDYFALYKRFPYPPGTEFITSRISPLTIKNPWNSGIASAYPIPELPTDRILFADAADEFGQFVSTEMDSGKHVYLLWSGGIDSTCVIVSVLKHMKAEHRELIHVVKSRASLDEHRMFYENFLSGFDQIDFVDLDFNKLDLEKCLVLDGEGGDQLFGSSFANKIFSMYPEKISGKWKNESAFISQHFRHSSESDSEWQSFLNIMETSIQQSQLEIDTLYQYCWWLNFNFKFDAVMFRTALYYTEGIDDHKFKYFLQNNICRMFATKKMQQWAMTAGQDEKTSNAGKMVKFSAKKYIFDFDHNEFYFREKRKEISLDRVCPVYFALDADYNRYSLGDRLIRQQLKEKFFPHDGTISFTYLPPPSPMAPSNWTSSPKNS